MMTQTISLAQLLCDISDFFLEKMHLNLLGWQKDWI